MKDSADHHADAHDQPDSDHVVASHEHHEGHDKHAGHSVAMFRDKFWIALGLTTPTLIWGHMLQSALGYTAPVFPGSRFIPPIFGAAVFLYGGLVFLRGAIQELRDRSPGMMTLIALAISVAFLFSVAVFLGFPGMPLWEELATLVTIMLLGHWMEMRSIAQAQGALKELSKLLPDEAIRIVAGGGPERDETVPVSALREGDTLLIRPGARVPADGKIQSGESSVNESMITGESSPVAKQAGGGVLAGTVNGSGVLRVTVTGTGDKTALAGIVRLVQQAQSSRSRSQVLADRAASWLTLVALGSGVLTLIVWLGIGSTPAFAVERFVTVLVIACPHALGLAVPLVVAISTTLAAKHGLLVRDRRGLEEARRINTVVFDKTGTLTKGEFGVVKVVTAEGVGTPEALRLAAALERNSEHTIAQGIVRSADEKRLDVPQVEKFEAIAGKGVKGIVDGRQLYVGGPALLSSLALAAPTNIAGAAIAAGQDGQASIYLAEDQRGVLALFVVADVIREESREAIQTLHDAGIQVVMMTGDARPVAEAVARMLNIDTVFAEVLPEDKAKKITELQQSGRRVAMVGDGVNDAPALVTANVGIAIGAGTDVAVEAGDIVLIRSDPRDIPRIITLSRDTYRKMVQNLWLAAGYNVIAIPLAAGVLARWGVILSPAVGAILMSVSTVVVAINAQLLRRSGV